MKVLIIGGTIFYGKLLALELLQQGHSVTIFSRGNIIPKELTTAGANFIKGDRTNYAEFPHYFTDQRFDVVYDNCVMTAADIENAVTTFKDKISHYIICSSVAVYSDWDRQTPYHEAEIDYDFVMQPNTSLTPTNQWLIDYGNGKRAAEKALLGSGIPYTIIRPTVIQGEQDPFARMWYYIERLLTKHPIAIPNNPKVAQLQHTYVQDIARFAALVINKNKPEGKAYNIAGDTEHSLESYIEQLAKLCQQKIQISHIDNQSLRERLPNYPLFFDRALTVNSSSAQTDYGFQPTPSAEWITKTAQWYIDQQADLLDKADACLREEELNTLT